MNDVLPLALLPSNTNFSCVPLPFGRGALDADDEVAIVGGTDCAEDGAVAAEDDALLLMLVVDDDESIGSTRVTRLALPPRRPLPV